MIFLFTNVILDITFGTIYWVLKKTKNGIYYMVWYDKTPKLLKYDKNIIDNLIKKTKQQEDEIKILKDNLKNLYKQFNLNNN